jgi:hypothetical protein
MSDMLCGKCRRYCFGNKPKVYYHNEKFLYGMYGPLDVKYPKTWVKKEEAYQIGMALKDVGSLR